MARTLYLVARACVIAMMIALLLAASTLPMASATAANAHTPFSPSGTVARAEVRVRIISAERVTLGRDEHPADGRLRWTKIAIDGEERDARLVEFY